jgi:ABC-2 family transporter protein
VFICVHLWLTNVSALVSRAVWENPIVRRELHGFGHRLRDWRLWIGLRLPREPREWGLPAITWFALAPYIQWVLLVALGRFSPSLLQYADPGTIFEFFLLGLGTYACAVATVIGATTVTHERELATWEQVAVTPMTTAELVLGYWLSRALPLGLGVVMSLLVWVVLYPHYMPLLERLGRFDLRQRDLLFLGLLLLTAVFSLNAFGLMFSTFCRSSAAAAVGALAGVVVIDCATWGALIGLWDRSIDIPIAAAMLIANVSVGSTALLVAGARLKLARRSESGALRRK